MCLLVARLICGDFEEFSFTIRGEDISPCFLVSFTNGIHQPCGEAIGLENLNRLSPVDRVEGFTEVDECNYCWQISGFFLASGFVLWWIYQSSHASAKLSPVGL